MNNFLYFKAISLSQQRVPYYNNSYEKRKLQFNYSLVNYFGKVTLNSIYKSPCNDEYSWLGMPSPLYFLISFG